MNIRTITQVNEKYIFTNDNGVQDRVAMNKDRLLEIKHGMIKEVDYIEYTLKRLNEELHSYDKLIEDKKSHIETLQKIIDDGIAKDMPVYKRGLAVECSDIEYHRDRLMSLYDNQLGLNQLSCKLHDEKMKYKKILDIIMSIEYKYNNKL